MFDGIEEAGTKGPPATEAQLDYLEILCDTTCTPMPFGLSVGEASDLISELKEIIEDGEDDGYQPLDF